MQVRQTLVVERRRMTRHHGRARQGPKQVEQRHRLRQNDEGKIKISQDYGLKFNPFATDVPVESLLTTPAVDSFCRRVEQHLGRQGGLPSKIRLCHPLESNWAGSIPFHAILGAFAAFVPSPVRQRSPRHGIDPTT